MRSLRGIGPCTGPWVASFPKLLTTIASGNSNNNCNSFNNSFSKFRSKSSPLSHLHLQTHRVSEGVQRRRRQQTCPRPITGTRGPSQSHPTTLLRRLQVAKRIFPVQVKKLTIRQCVSRKFSDFRLSRNSGNPEFKNFPVQKLCFEVRNFPKKNPKIFPKIRSEIFGLKSGNSGFSGNSGMHCLSLTGQKSPNFVILGLIFGLIFGPNFGLSKKAKFRTSLPERKSTGNSGPEFPGSGFHFHENTPDFENVSGTHCLNLQ
jgi:hypothetical protein